MLLWNKNGLPGFILPIMRSAEEKTKIRLEISINSVHLQLAEQTEFNGLIHSDSVFICSIQTTNLEICFGTFASHLEVSLGQLHSMLLCSVSFAVLRADANTSIQQQPSELRFTCLRLKTRQICIVSYSIHL